MSKVTPLFPTIDEEHAAKYFHGVCGTCRRPKVRPEHAPRVHQSFFGKSLTKDGVEHYVCTCKDPKSDPKPPNGLQSIFDSWLSSVNDLQTTLERAKLRHDINESLPPELVPFRTLIGMLVDPTGVAVEMSQKYWEKQAAEKRAEAPTKPVKRRKGMPAPNRCHCSGLAGRQAGRHHWVCAYNSKAPEAERGTRPPSVILPVQAEHRRARPAKRPKTTKKKGKRR